MTFRHCFFAAALSLLTCMSTQASPSWTIYHSWNANQEYTRRGVLEWSEEESKMVVKNDNDALMPEDIPAMLDYGWYHIKIELPDSENDDFVMASVPACNLRRANFKDEVLVVLPRSSESQITSLTYTPLISPLAPTTCDDLRLPSSLVDAEKVSFATQVNVELDTPGMPLKVVLPHTKPPPGLTFLTHPNAKKGSAAGAGDRTGSPPPGEEGGSQQSFIRRYWYVLLPVILANFFGPAEPAAAPEGSEASGGGGAVAPAAGGASQVAAPTGSPSKRARRGKRGQ